MARCVDTINPSFISVTPVADTAFTGWMGRVSQLQLLEPTTPDTRRYLSELPESLSQE
jgi:hypothetical protein